MRHRDENDAESVTHTVYVIEDGNVPVRRFPYQLLQAAAMSAAVHSLQGVEVQLAAVL